MKAKEEIGIQLMKSHKTCGGLTQFWSHPSRATGTAMRFSTFIPDGTVIGCVLWLSGLTCTEENFISKAGAQKALQECGLMVLCPDTSPRGLSLPHEHDAIDFGSGAGFYLDATTTGYADHYRMETYVVEEMPRILDESFHIPVDRVSIVGHSMGGHGALTLGLRHPERFRSISAFSPIANPSRCAWGRKAFTGYLGADEGVWRTHDATYLIEDGARHPMPILIDQGTQDEFLAQGQLLPENFARACGLAKQDLMLNLREGYDHSYYFIATWIDSHVRHHANVLRELR